MNSKLQKFARDSILEGLLKLPNKNQIVFKMMYSREGLDVSMEDVVENMKEEDLDWAMQQVENTTKKEGL